MNLRQFIMAAVILCATISSVGCGTDDEQKSTNKMITSCLKEKGLDGYIKNGSFVLKGRNGETDEFDPINGTVILKDSIGASLGKKRIEDMGEYDKTIIDAVNKCMRSAMVQNLGTKKPIALKP